MMNIQMSSIAWEQGKHNARVVSIGFAVWELLLIFAIHFITHQSLWFSAVSGLLLSWVGIILFFFFILLRDWLRRGKLELDCGQHPMRWIFILNACLASIAFLYLPSLILPASHMVLRIAIALSPALFYLFLAFGHLRIYDQGIWLYHALLTWEKIKSYQWKDSTLVIKTHRKIPFLGTALTFLPEQQAAVDAMLHSHLDERLAPETTPSQ